jgi:ADP-heptose:LPS heptosyltransferase
VLAIAVHNDILQGIAALQRVVPFWRVPGPELDRILIVKLDRIGDMVTTTPVFDALRARFPNARLDVVGHPVPLTLLANDARIGERIPYRAWLYHPRKWCIPGPSALLLVMKLLWRRYPLVVYLRGSGPFLFLGLTSRLAATKFIVAEPVITRYLKALETVLGPQGRPRARLAVYPDAARFAQKLLSSSDIGPRVAVHSTASSDTKTWPAERFAAVADALATNCSAQVHFFAAPAERQVLDEIARLARHTHRYHVGLELPQVVAAIAASDLFIGNDSGLAHIAAAVETPAVVLWGSANLSMARPEAPPEQCRILYHDLHCRASCPEFRCTNPVHVECMNRIQTDDVVTAARELLAGSSRQRLPVVEPAPIACCEANVEHHAAC